MLAARSTAGSPVPFRVVASTLATAGLVIAIAVAAAGGTGSSLSARVSPPDDVRIGSPVRLARAGDDIRIGSPVRLARAGDDVRVGSPVRLASTEGTAARSPIRPVRTV